MKTCCECGQTKTLAEYHKDKQFKDGHRRKCKTCVSDYMKELYVANRECILESRKEHYQSNKDSVKARVERYRKEDPERYSRRLARWGAANRPRRNAYGAKYRAAKKQATPKWFEKDKVDIVYQKADELGFEVDHVVPLTSDIVCGLHCWYNLQLLDQPLNSGKRNYHWPDMP